MCVCHAFSQLGFWLIFHNIFFLILTFYLKFETFWLICTGIPLIDACLRIKCSNLVGIAWKLSLSLLSLLLSIISLSLSLHDMINPIIIMITSIIIIMFRKYDQTHVSCSGRKINLDSSNNSIGFTQYNLYQLTARRWHVVNSRAYRESFGMYSFA